MKVDSKYASDQKLTGINRSSTRIINEKFDKLPWFQKFGYYFAIIAIVVGVAILQGYLSYNSETNLIDLQAESTCSSIFDLVNRGWLEVKLFTETLSAGFISSNNTFTHDTYWSLGLSVAVQSIEAMQMLQFVKHLDNDVERVEWENQMKIELNDSNFIMHGFNPSAPIPWNFTTSDYTCLGEYCGAYHPIIYNTDPAQTFVVGFIPYPEVPREKALVLAMSTKKIAASGRVNLVGETDNPAGILAYLPLYSKSGTATQNASDTDDLFGFVNPVFKIDLMLTRVLEQLSFQYIHVYAFDVTNGIEEYMGKYPKPAHSEYETREGQNIAWNTEEYNNIKTRNIDVGSRDWKVVCAVENKYVSEKRSALPYLIFGMSLGISVVYNVMRIGLKYCLAKIN